MRGFISRGGFAGIGVLTVSLGLGPTAGSIPPETGAVTVVVSESLAQASTSPLLVSVRVVPFSSAAQSAAPVSRVETSPLAVAAQSVRVTDAAKAGVVSAEAQSAAGQLVIDSRALEAKTSAAGIIVASVRLVGVSAVGGKVAQGPKVGSSSTTVSVSSTSQVSTVTAKTGRRV